MSGLPPGFVLEQAPQGDLPPGFVLEPQGNAVPRMVGQVAQGTNDAIANAAGAPADLVAAGLRQVGIPVNRPVLGSESIKGGIDFLASIPGRVGLTTEGAPVRHEPVTRGEKIANMVGQGVGSALSTIVPAGIAARALPAGTVGQGVAQTLASQPVAQVATSGLAGAATGSTDNPYVGLATALAVPVAISAGRAAISPTTNRLNANQRALVAAMEREGITPTPAQATGSPTLRGLEETMSRIPGSAGAMRGRFDDQAADFGRAVMQRTGTTANEASPLILTQAHNRLGQAFDDLAARTVVNPDVQFARDVLNVAQNYGRRLDTDVAAVFRSYMDDLQPLIQAIGTPGANPQIGGEVYRTIRSNLTTRIRESGNQPLRRALGGLVEALDDVMERSTSGALRQEWQQARSQYRALMTVDKAMRGGTQADRSAARIPFGSFANAVKADDKTGYARARGQYGELAKIADMLAPQIPNSGTPERLMWANLLTGGAIGGGAGLATGDVGTALATAAATTAAPAGVARLYNSDTMRRYLTNQAAGRTDFGALYGGEAARQLVDASGPTNVRALARALQSENERRRRPAR